ncbi:LysM peptidoglycan-binding domain-containing protein [Cytobacillus horneckiae]|uniref:LysM peptidoglycan-binding domain-containing protein n=1 Tax=Cytobacillus horneckiae TaxID=549687 RepID=UPI0034CD3795
MAQYQKNFYSSSLYGRIKAFYGEYLTEIFDAQEPFSYKINARIEAVLPSSFYPANSKEFIKAEESAWSIRNTDIYTTKPNSPVEIYVTGENVAVHVRTQNKGAQTVQAKLYLEELISGAYTWVEKEVKSVSTLSETNPNTVKEILFESTGFNDYKIVIQALEPTIEAIIVGVKARTADFSLEIRASKDNKTWSSWEKMPLVKTPQGQQHLVTGQSLTVYNDVRYVQGKIILLASDNKTNPIIDRVELRSDDSGLYDYDGEYTINIDMAQVATSVGATFKHTDKIRWIEQQPPGTELDIRSSSSRDNIFWGPITAPYRQNTKRLRLKRGITTHSATLGVIDEGSKFAYGKTISMHEWDTQAYYPKDESNVKTTYIFSKTFKDQKDPRNLLQQVINPMSAQNKAIQFAPQPYYLTVEMTRSALSGTPVVDVIDIYQTIQYKEPVNITDKDVSAVDGEGQGYKSLQKISDYGFSYPKGANHIPYNQEQISTAQQIYLLEDRSNRPSDLMLYFKSEEDKGVRTNKSILATDQIIAKVTSRKLEFGEETGVLMHYQYGAGKVQYLRPYERELDSTFTPSLLSDLKYRYYIENGWPSEVHMVINGQTIEDVASMYNAKVELIKEINRDLLYNEDGTLTRGQRIEIPNTSRNNKVSLLFKNQTPYTQKSSHNAVYDQSKGKVVTDFSSEPISISVPEAPPKGYVDWVSEEKIYSGIINHNDIREEFIRTQYNRSTYSDYDRDYTVVAGDTWESIASKYDIHIYDLKMANESITELTEGSGIIIPPNIILPSLAPEAEFDKENPYEISIIKDSVHKKNGEVIDESFIPINWEGKHLPLEVTYRDSVLLTAEVTRGTDRNGMDPLPLSNVKEIVSIKNESGNITYHEWNPDLQAGDYKLMSNYIDWSPSKAGDLEPEAGSKYIVTYIRKEVDKLVIHLDTDYSEEVGTDLVWRSPEVKVFDGVCTPTQDFKMELPSVETFEGFDEIYKNIGYIVEDNDLWVETKVINEEGKEYLVGTLNGKDPSKNWHPTINTGYYYLKEQEKYLYSEPLKTVLNEKELPTAKNIEYVNGSTGVGVLLLPKSQNVVKDSGFQVSNWKKSKVLSINES